MAEDPRAHLTHKRTEPLPYPGGLTVTEALDWCARNGRNPDEVILTGGHFRWMHTETDEERDLRVQRWEVAQERNKEWVKNRYHELYPDGE